MSISKKILPPAIIIGLMTAVIVATLALNPTVTTRTPTSEDNPEAPRVMQDTFMRGTVTKILGETQEIDEITLGSARVQKLEVRIKSGEETGKTIPLEHRVQNRPGAENQRLDIGSRIIVGKNTSPQSVLYYISDVYRLNALWVVLAIFFLLTLLFSGYRGVMAFLGLVFSLFMVMSFVIPRILAGQNPFLISIIATTLIATLSLYLAHGVKKRTTVAVIATLLAIGVALAVSTLVVRFVALFGMGTEEAFYLQFAPIAPINLQGLFLGAIIIGVLGILDDVTTTQAATVEEIAKANPAVSFATLYRRGASVGREHITSLVNTLVLAYTGASFPLLLLFTIYERPAWVTLNSELVMEEVMRTLIGSITLIFAVPLTTALAALVFTKKKSGH
ncbi:MAG: YibE/F family protein [Patescibacteria group bacterium]